MGHHIFAILARVKQFLVYFRVLIRLFFKIMSAKRVLSISSDASTYLLATNVEVLECRLWGNMDMRERQGS